MKNRLVRTAIACISPRQLPGGKPGKYCGDFLQGISWDIQTRQSARIVIEDASGHRSVLVHSDDHGLRGHRKYYIPKSLLGRVKIYLETADALAIARVVVSLEEDYEMEKYRQ